MSVLLFPASILSLTDFLSEPGSDRDESFLDFLWSFVSH